MFLAVAKETIEEGAGRKKVMKEGKACRKIHGIN
jgi:hypothetical protein